MISDIIALLKFIADPGSRKFVQSLTSIRTLNKLDWELNVKTAEASFKGDEAFKSVGFANSLIAEMCQIEVQQNELRKFKMIFDELVRNAFEHGCKNDGKYKVKIKCIYSPWFITLEVSDSGRGFDLDEALQKYDDDTHGLHLVKSLSYRFSVKDNSVATSLIISEPILKIMPRIKLVDNTEILILKIVEKSEWHYLITSWNPLREILRESNQKYIAIECFNFNWKTISGREVKEVINEFADYENRYIAIGVDRQANGFYDFSKMNSDRLQIFFNPNASISWLISKIKEEEV